MIKKLRYSKAFMLENTLILVFIFNVSRETINMENGAAHYDAILHAVTLVCSKTTSVERPCHLKKTRRAITPDQARRRAGGERGGRMRGVTNYIGTPDLAATATRILLQGGRIIRERTEIPGEGTFLLFQDPDGIRWGAFQANAP